MELKHPTIPRISLPRDKLCPIEELELHLTNPNKDLIDKCEMYAKMALIMFYPFCELSDLTCIGGSYLKRFNQELTSHHNKEDTKFIFLKDLTDVCVCVCGVYRKYGIVDHVCITANNCKCQ